MCVSLIYVRLYDSVSTLTHTHVNMHVYVHTRVHTHKHTNTHTHKLVHIQPIVITPEGNKYWLSKEDVLAKGVPENEVENFK